MKFSVKLSIAISLLLAAVLSLGGFLLVNRSFQSSLEAAVRQSTREHLMEKYTLEADLLDWLAEGITPTAASYGYSIAALGEYIGGEQRTVAVLDGDGRPVYSALPEALSDADIADTLAAAPYDCVMRERGGVHYLLMASKVQTSGDALTLLSATDVSAIFRERAAQMRYLWQMEGILLAEGIAVTVVLSLLLTRPIRKLNAAAGRIAAGKYGQRTGVRGGDEIGELAASFDRMAGAVQKNVDGLNESIRQRDEFVTAFSHEVKTPITSLVGYADILRRTEEEPEVRQMAAGYIYSEARRLESLGRKLMELMGLTEQAIEMEAFPATALLDDLRASLQASAPAARLVFTGDTAAALCADRILAGDLLLNLVLNALAASGAASLVRVHLRAGRGSCRILVCDAGRGIPAAEVANVTRPFYMVDKSRARRSGGSGIGLALAQKIAALHGGALRIISRPGRGTIVRFTLPLVPNGEGSHEA